MDTWRLVICVVLVASFPLEIGAVISGLVDTTVLLGGTTTLYCSFPQDTQARLTQWRKDGVTIADPNGIYGSQYVGFQVITSSSTPATNTRLDLVIPNAKVSYEGIYECEVTDQEKASADLTVEIQGAEPTIALTQPSTGSLMEGVEGKLTCIATGYRPEVKLLWFRNEDRIQTGITETTSVNGDTTDTMSVWTFTPSWDYNDDTIECRTNITDRISQSRTGSFTLDVKFAPVVTVKYSNKVVTCNAVSNPAPDELNYKIIFNKTDIVKQGNNGVSHSFTPDYCTDISCNVTNAVGTREGVIAAQICPGHVDPTPTPSMTTDKNGGLKPTVEPPGRKGLAPGIIAVIVVCSVGAVALVVVVIVICYFKRLYCFGSNKTKNDPEG